MKAKLKELTNRSNGWGYEKEWKQKLRGIHTRMGGVLSSFKYESNCSLENGQMAAQTNTQEIYGGVLEEEEVKTRIANLVRCGIDKYQAYVWGNSRLRYWHCSRQSSFENIYQLFNDSLRKAGMSALIGSYVSNKHQK